MPSLLDSSGRQLQTLALFRGLSPSLLPRGFGEERVANGVQSVKSFELTSLRLGHAAMPSGFKLGLANQRWSELWVRSNFL